MHMRVCRVSTHKESGGGTWDTPHRESKAEMETSMPEKCKEMRMVRS